MSNEVTSKYLCVDPSMALTGWAVVSCMEHGPVVLSSGTIKTEKEHDKQYMSDFIRWEQIVRGLAAAAEGCGAVVFEASAGYGGRASSRSAICMKSSQAMVAAVTGIRSLPWEAYLPQAVKKALTGTRSATKAKVARVVRMDVVGAGDAIDAQSTKPKREAVADALAVGLVAWDSRIIRMLRQNR